MRLLGAFVVLAFGVGCGDNIVPENGSLKPKSSPSATSSVGGSQVSHSKSFMLVTSVAAGDAKVQRNSKQVLQPGVGGE
jgi:hypothetical protein